jgi:hypothetical protein
MGPLSGTGVRLAAVCVLLSVAAVSCAAPAPGASPPGAGGQTSVTVQLPSASASVTPVRITNGPATDTAIPTTPVPKGCLSGTVAITHLPAEADTSTVCIKARARLRLTLPGEGLDGWTPLQVTPEGAATVAYTTDSTDILAAIVSPTGTAPFCLSTGTRSLESQPAYSWRLCVTVRR